VLDEALRQGAQSGPAQDGLLESREWGFELEAIRAELLPTLLWHGGADESVPPAVGRYVAEHVAGCRATFIAGESHTLLRRHWRPILAALVAASRRPADASRL
jgi:pimeloyl-ACP methyl ester carboxylesterase